MGGGITFSPDNLSKIPIPSLTQEQTNDLQKMSETYSQHFDETAQDELDDYVYQLYRLTQEEVNVLEDFKVKTRRKR